MTLYGLPSKVCYCERCVISNQKPVSSKQHNDRANTQKETVFFDEEGICSACRIQEKKAQIDWNERFSMLTSLLDKYRSKDGSYDCIVPGSGGKDSCLAAHILKYKFGMNPLTVTWRPHLYTSWGRNNFDSWLDSGFANILMNPNPKTHRILARLALENLFHPFQTFGLGQFSLPAKLAVKFKIPLIFYGEDGAEYGDRASNYFDDPSKANDIDNDYYDNKSSNFSLAGIPLDILKHDYKLPMSDLNYYLPPDRDELDENNIIIAKLGYYIPWRPQNAFHYASNNCGFRPSPERSQGSYTKFNSIDDKLDDIFYWTMHVKFCQGKASLDACQDIWSGEISRDEGVSLVQKYDGEYPERFEKEVFQYLSVSSLSHPSSPVSNLKNLTRDYLFDLSEKFRPDHLWEKDNLGNWKQKHFVQKNNASVSTSDWEGNVPHFKFFS